MEQSMDQAGTQQILMAKKLMLLEKQIKSGVGAFYWIAGFSLINTLIHLTGGTTTFVIGLGITQFIDGYAQGLVEEIGSPSGTIIMAFGIFLDIAVAGLFVLMSIFGNKRHASVVIMGMVFYAMDGFIFLFFQDWYSLLFHALMLLSLWRGYKAIGELNKLEENYSTGGLSAVQNLIAANPIKPVITPEENKKQSRNLVLFTLILGIPMGILLILVVFIGASR